MRALLIPLVFVAACGGKKAPAPSEDAPPTLTVSSVEIPAGRLVVGSMPNLVGRVSALEARRVPVELEEFSIDRQPRVREGALLTGLSRDAAASVCEADDKRLCTELEWERACAGNTSNVYPTGSSFDVIRCRTEACRSSFGIEALGTRVGEWTGSSVEINGRTHAVVRGSASDRALDHRCAFRRLVDASTTNEEIGFRCCEGDPNEASYPSLRSERVPVFEPVTLDADEIRAALASTPELSGVASSFRTFSDADRAALVARAAQRTPPINIDAARVVRGPLRWTPTPGETVLVLSGRSGNSAVIAVLYPLGDGGYAHAASLTMTSEPNPVVITLRDPAAKTLGFSTCFGCGAEDGEIRLRDDGRFIVVTR